MKEKESSFETFDVTGYSGQPVRNLSEWQRHSLPPERAYHWKPGRSACELGRAWSTEEAVRVPRSLTALLDSQPSLRGATLTSAIIEHETPLPYQGKGRCHDLLVLGHDAGGELLVLSIEAKADEPFDAKLAVKIEKLGGKASRQPDRIEWLTQLLLGESAFENLAERRLKSSLRSIGYQLLSSLGGLCVEAEKRGATKAIMLYHEFRTHLTSDESMVANNISLAAFLERLALAHGHRYDGSVSGKLIGPFVTRSGGFAAIPFPRPIALYIGKLTDDLIAEGTTAQAAFSTFGE